MLDNVRRCDDDDLILLFDKTTGEQTLGLIEYTATGKRGEVGINKMSTGGTLDFSTRTTIKLVYNKITPKRKRK